MGKALRHLYRVIIAAAILLASGCAPLAVDPVSLAAPQPTVSPFPTALQEVTPTSTPIQGASAEVITPSPATTALANPATPTPLSDSPARAPIATLTALAQDPEAWRSLPIVPLVSAHVKDIYQRGLELGNNPQAFSKIGDCGSTPAWFLGDFDRGPQYFRLGEHEDLLPVIQAFQGSYSRTSLAAKAGFNASSVLTPLWADPAQCAANESPLSCELRLHRPMFAFITLGTNDIWRPEAFEPQLRTILETLLEAGVVPILSTKADDLEGDGSLNATIARLAAEYDLPLWNYWLAVQSLPFNGLQEDGAHITWAPNRFDDPKAMEKGWPVRNLTALQVLDAVWQAAAQP